jgi:5,10-methylenetetrahydromethanopterin reductase
VPVDVAATGPKVIAAAARQADRLTLALGADPERVAWGIESARAARAADGQNPDDLPIGAFVNVVVTDDLEAGRRLVSGGMSTFARFNVMHGVTAGPADEADRAMLGRLHDAYDMRLHTRLDSPQAATLEPEFVDRFGIVGPASHCLERLGALVDLGIGRFVIVGPSLGASRDEAREASTRFVEEVLPGLRA